MRTMMSCATALLVAIGGALTGCDLDDPMDPLEERLDEDELSEDELGDEPSEDDSLDALADPSQQESPSLTCGQELSQDEAYCDSAFNLNVDFACCMANVSCKKNAGWDHCDCLYALGSPAHQACYDSVAGQFLADKAMCIGMYF